MREIKFRAWNNFFKEMYYFDFENNIEVRSGHLWIVHEEGAISSKSPSITIMQYTGLEDKNGTEVYEGDIVHARVYYSCEDWFDAGEHDYDFIADVKWDNEKMAYLCNGYYLHEIEEVEIVGNIYENPELLD